MVETDTDPPVAKRARLSRASKTKARETISSIAHQSKREEQQEDPAPKKEKEQIDAPVSNSKPKSTTATKKQASAKAKKPKAATKSKKPAAKKTTTRTNEGESDAKSATKPPPSTKNPKPPAKKQKKEPAEKRLKRFRKVCAAPTQQRINRAKTQRLFLIHDSTMDNTPDKTTGGNTKDAAGATTGGNTKDAAGATTAADTVADLPTHEEYGGPTCTFAVLGSTGNIYDVTLCKVPHCTCPDHAKGNLCKHILFVLLKVVQLPSGSPLVYQQAYLTSELDEIFTCMISRRSAILRSGSVANQAVRNTYAAMANKPDKEDEEKGTDILDTGVQQKSFADNSECAICFDTMTSRCKVVFCRGTCGTNFHSECIDNWMKHSDSTVRGGSTCPACRQPWLTEKDLKMAANGDGDGGGGKDGVNREGYQNLGKLQGVSSTRDTSTYNTYRRRYYDDRDSDGTRSYDSRDEWRYYG